MTQPARHLQAAPATRPGQPVRVDLPGGWSVEQISLTLTGHPATDGTWLVVRHGPYLRGQVRTPDEAAAVLARHGITWAG
jgi:hypothetical protein